MPGPPPKAAARRQRSRRDMGANIGMLSKPGNRPACPGACASRRRPPGPATGKTPCPGSCGHPMRRSCCAG